MGILARRSIDSDKDTSGCQVVVEEMDSHVLPGAGLSIESMSQGCSLYT